MGNRSVTETLTSEVRAGVKIVEKNETAPHMEVYSGSEM